ncbi:phosphoribosylaminoimidazole carboxylase, catalytic subunit [Vibrio cholerae O1 str. EM-1626]|nr:phosphoribosylaminoimidazole carboxylase, catalytic subunit [Vibrio cholerae O1 str. EM-1626]
MTVGIIMGSKSDWPTMKHAAEMLDQFGVAYETKVVSCAPNSSSFGRLCL